MRKYQWLFSDPVTTADACARRWVLEADFHRRAKKICVMGFPGRVIPIDVLFVAENESQITLEYEPKARIEERHLPP